MLKYARVILNSDNVDEVIKKYNFEKKTDFAFYDLIYVNKNGAAITDDTLKIRVYQINQWKSKDVLVIRKDAPIINGSKEDRVLLKEEFDTEEEALAFVEKEFSKDYDFAFKLQKDGIEYGNGDVRLWRENVDNVGISIEVGSEDEEKIEDVLKDLDVRERLIQSLPEYMYEKQKDKSSMIKHVVLYKFKSSISEHDIEQIIYNFEKCKEVLDGGLIDVEFGKNCSSKIEFDNGFNYGLFMTFRDANAITSYNQLEFHKEAQKIMKPHQEKLLVFDIKC